MRADPQLSSSLRADVETLWDYHDMHHTLRPADVGIGLGSHDLGVATYTAELFTQGLFPLIVFTGANAPTTIDRFPRGEAIHYRDHAVSLGVPADRILVEPHATNTGQNIDYTRELLDGHDIAVTSPQLSSSPGPTSSAGRTPPPRSDGRRSMSSAHPAHCPWTNT